MNLVDCYYLKWGVVNEKMPIPSRIGIFCGCSSLVHRPVGIMGLDLVGVIVQGLHVRNAEAVCAARLVVHRVLAQPWVFLFELSYGNTMFLGKSSEVIDLLGGSDNLFGGDIGVQLRTLEYESICLGTLENHLGGQDTEHIA